MNETEGVVDRVVIGGVAPANAVCRAAIAGRGAAAALAIAEHQDQCAVGEEAVAAEGVLQLRVSGENRTLGIAPATAIYVEEVSQ